MKGREKTLVYKKTNSKKKEVKKDYEPDIEIEEDPFGYGGGSYGKDKGSYKSIVMEQYRKCCEEGSKEMTSGGVIKRIIDGELVEIMSIDQVEVFTNSVEMLKNLLIATIKKFYSVIGKKMELVEKEITENDVKRKQAYRRLNLWYKKKSNIANPEGVSEAQNNHSYYIQMNKEIQKIYHQNKLISHKKLLGVLGLLLSHINYFDEIAGTGIY